MKRLAPLLLLLACDEVTAPRPGAPPLEKAVIVAAASDLTQAFDEMGTAFKARTKQPVTVTFGASGSLQKQISAGAPFDVFASANAGFVDALVASKDCFADTRAPYALGHLVLWSKRDGAHALEELTDARFKKIAIANPETAPYGKAAREALVKAGLWEKLEPKLVIGDSIKQTLQYADTGNAEAALVALSLVVDRPPYVRIDESMHGAIDQTLVVCRHGQNSEGGKAFAQFVNSEAGRAIMRRHGLLLPGEALAPAH